MFYRFTFIFLVVGVAVLFTFKSVYAENPLPQRETNVPSQLKPPSEDVAQLDEAIDDSAEGKSYSFLRGYW